MRRFLIWVCAILALPTYWSVDKALQKYAVSIASQRVVAEASDPEFWVRTFNLKTLPLRQGVDFVEDDSIDSNGITRLISGAFEDPVFDREVILVLRAKNGKRTWLKYHLTVCGERYCPFDATKFQPTQPLSKEEMQLKSQEKHRRISVLGYPLIVVFAVGVDGVGNILFSDLYILDDGRNPVDRTLRQLSASTAPEFWSRAWEANSDLLLDAIAAR